ncbi:hypothetical protein OUZ56_025094 [Daphnia magna]|uniref:Uncharacterized protein n=1 Tax=Daphnia magna TaxID=35525 RepID=A0ABQ9ZIU5_9CRUS|nr:hypothetical protein OUZ56_025094 [Daphnia magna]
MPKENSRFLTVFVNPKFDKDHENVNLFSDGPINKELLDNLKPEVRQCFKSSKVTISVMTP